MVTMLAALAGFLLVLFIVLIVLYVLGSLGLMGIAKKQDVKGGWMAWIPYLNFYLVGKLAVENKFAQWVLPILYLLAAEYTTKVDDKVITNYLIPQPFSGIAALVAMIMTLVYLYKIYNKVSDKAVIMLVFTIITLGLIAPIFLFAIRNNEVRA